MRKRAAILIIVAAAVIASLQIHRRAQIELNEKEAVWRRQVLRLADLTTEIYHLSNRLAQANNAQSEEDHIREAAELRAKIETLREQTNQLADLADQRRHERLYAGTQFFSEGDSNLLEHIRETTISFNNGPRAVGKLNDARALTAALRKYADEHGGAFPLSLELTGPYLPEPLETDSPPWANAPLSGTNDFEILYEGFQDDLTNIPPRRVALIRERQPWQNPEGKWKRVYGYADGAAEIVESDDNFQSWDAQHIIPPIHKR